MNRKIFSGASLEAFVHDKPSPTIVVTFAERREPPPASFSGEGMLAKTDYAYCCIRSLDNDWYVGPEFTPCIAEVAKATAGYSNVILYGFSMGSYGALMAAQPLRANRVIVMAPIANIHPQKDKRWIADYRQHIVGKSVEDMTPVIPKGTRMVCVYDPKGPDRQHVADLRAAHPVDVVHTPRAGHMVSQFLNSAGILGTVTRDLFKPDVSIPAIQRLVTSSRKNNSYYMGELGRALSRHKALRRMLLRYAVRRFPDDLNMRLDYAGLIAEDGVSEEAAALIRAAVRDNPRSALSVPVIRALGQYAEHGGTYDGVADLIAPYASSAPRAREAQLLYSRFLRHTKRFNEAMMAHEQFMKGGPFSAQGFYERGLILEELGLFLLAGDQYRKSLEEVPGFPRAVKQLALVEKRQAASGTAS